MGEVRDPQLVRPLGGEVLLDGIGGPFSGGVRSGGPHLPCPLDASDPQPAHQPGDLVAADVMARSPGGDPQLARPMDRVVGVPQRQRQRHQHGVAQRPGRRRPALG